MTVRQNTARDAKHGPSADELWDAAAKLYYLYGEALRTDYCQLCGAENKRETAESERIWKEYISAQRAWAAVTFQEEAP